MSKIKEEKQEVVVNNLISELVAKLLEARLSKDKNRIVEAIDDIKRNTKNLVGVSGKGNSVIAELIGSTIDEDVDKLLLSILRDPDFILSEKDKNGLIDYLVSQAAGNLSRATIDGLVKKGLKAPIVENILGIFNHNRSVGLLSNLAISLIEHKDNYRLFRELLSLRNNGRVVLYTDTKGGDNDIYKNVTHDRLRRIQLVVSDLQEINNHSSPRHIAALIECYINLNDDGKLKSLLGKSRRVGIDLGDVYIQSNFLHLATSHGHSKTLNILISGGFDPRSVDSGGRNFFAYACLNPSSEFINRYIDVLLEQQESGKVNVSKIVNSLDNEGNSAFDLVVKSGYIRPVALILKRVGGIKINFKKNLFDTIKNQNPKLFSFLLHSALRDEGIKGLIKICGKTIVSNNNKSSALMAGVLLNFIKENNLNFTDVDLLKALEKITTEESLITSDDLQFISENLGSEQLSMCLKKIYDDIDEKGELSEDRRRELLSERINDKSKDGKSALFRAIEGKCYVDNARLLIKNGAKVDDAGVDHEGEQMSIIELAVKYSHPRTIESLLQTRKIPQEQIQKSANMIIRSNNAVLTRSFLMNLGNEGFKALNHDLIDSLFSLSVQNRRHDCVEEIENYFLFNGKLEDFITLVNKPMKSGYYPLQLAILNGNFSMVKKLTPHIDCSSKFTEEPHNHQWNIEYASNVANLDSTERKEREEAIPSARSPYSNPKDVQASRIKDSGKSKFYLDYAIEKLGHRSRIISFLDKNGFHEIGDTGSCIAM